MLFKRKARPLTELETAVANGCAQAAAGLQNSDVVQQRNMLENALLIDDVHFSGLLDGMSQYTFKDDRGVCGEKGKEYKGAIPKYIAAYICTSHLIRTSFLDERQARILARSHHRLFTRAKMMLTEEEMKMGGALILDSVYEIVKVNDFTAINGRLAKLVKSNPRSVDVTVAQGTGAMSPKERF